MMPSRSALGLMLVVSLAAACSAADSIDNKLPKDLENIGVDEKLDAPLPLDLSFVDEDDRPVQLRQFFNGKRPVILTLNYSACPMLCSMQLNGLVKGMLGMDWSAGREFEIVTVSIDPNETQQKMRNAKRRFTTAYGREVAQQGWHFLRGNEAEIQALAQAVGFRYAWHPVRQEYIHAAALMLCTPDGRVSRYLYGLDYDERTLRLSLAEVSEGKIGTTLLDRVLLFCFHYDASVGRYGLAAKRVMQAGAALTVLVLGVFLGGFWVREWRRSRASTPVGS